jgi:hypothetical protein
MLADHGAILRLLLRVKSQPPLIVTKRVVLVESMTVMYLKNVVMVHMVMALDHYTHLAWDRQASTAFEPPQHRSRG